MGDILKNFQKLKYQEVIMKRVPVLWIIVALLLIAYVQPATPAPSGPVATPTSSEPIIIGDISSLSGSIAMQGTTGNQGAILAVEEINQKGGVLGRPLKLVIRNDKSLPEESTNAFRELAAEGSLVMIGNSTSASHAAVSPLAKEQKVPYFAVMGYTAALTDALGHLYFFTLNTSDRVFGRIMADFLAKQKYARYAIIGNDFAYGHSIINGVLNRLKQSKPDVQVVSENWVPMTATDFTSNITAIMSKKPDAVMFGGLVGASASAFVKQAISFGLFSSTAAVHPTLGMPINNAGLTTKEDVPEGVLTGTDYPYPPANTPVGKAFYDAYKKRWNQVPMDTSSDAYTTIKFIAQAIQKAGKLDREAIINAAEGMSIEHPAFGNITVRAFDHRSTSGWWMGYLTWDPTNNRPGMRDTWYVPGEPYLPSQEEIQKLRAGK
jgi:branched-chain amino acid transport system substrate-binding protein